MVVGALRRLDLGQALDWRRQVDPVSAVRYELSTFRYSPTTSGSKLRVALRACPIGVRGNREYLIRNYCVVNVKCTLLK